MKPTEEHDKIASEIADSFAEPGMDRHRLRVAIAQALAAEREKAAKRCDEAGEEVDCATYQDAEDNWRAACAHCREMIRVMP